MYSMSHLKVVCNTRNLYGHMTGVQRYTDELIQRFGSGMITVKPKSSLHGISGHIWEQFILPFRLEGRLLWSPANTGPLSVEKQVLSLMDVTPLDHPEWMSRRFSAWYTYFVPRLVRKVRKVITISEFSRERIISYCPECADKVEVTYLAVDSRFVPESSQRISEIIKILKIPSPHYLLALGSLEPRKNLKTILKAWARIQHLIPEEIWLILAGAKGKKIIFGDMSFDKLPERVFLAGHVPDVCLPALYSGALATVYLSLYEGFGLPPLEAMACGSPVLSSGTTSLPEVVGDAAILVDPHHTDEICEAMMRLINDASLREKLHQRGLARAGRFSWDITAAKTMEILVKANTP